MVRLAVRVESHLVPLPASSGLFEVLQKPPSIRSRYAEDAGWRWCSFDTSHVGNPRGGEPLCVIQFDMGVQLSTLRSRRDLAGRGRATEWIERFCRGSGAADPSATPLAEAELRGLLPPGPAPPTRGGGSRLFGGALEDFVQVDFVIVRRNGRSSSQFGFHPCWLR